MPNLLVFSRNLLAVSGGAELSLINLINKKSACFDKIILCSMGDENIQDIDLPVNAITVCLGKEIPILSKFPFLEYFVFKSRIRSLIERLIAKEAITDAWTQNLWAPMLKHKKLTVYLRDESALGMRPIYMKGWRYLASLGVRLFEYIFFRWYQAELHDMYRNCHQIVANSEWMSNKLKLIFGQGSTVEYPNIEADSLLDLYNKGQVTASDIVMIGGEYVKGVDIFLDLACIFKDEKFVIYSKKTLNRAFPPNVTQELWSKDRSSPYRRAKLVLVPSIWQEAFGRVAAECKALGVPVIVSDKGGLPEAVNYEERSIAGNYLEFVKKVGENL